MVLCQKQTIFPYTLKHQEVILPGNVDPQTVDLSWAYKIIEIDDFVLDLKNNWNQGLLQFVQNIDPCSKIKDFPNMDRCEPWCDSYQ